MSSQLPTPLDQPMNDDPKDMSFVDHLEELRWHIIRCLMAIGVITIVVFIFTKPIFNNIILSPKSENFLTYKGFCSLSHSIGFGDAMCLKPKDFTIQNITMMGQFLTNLKIAIILGFISSFPYIFWEIWRFIRPGLYENERKVTRGMVFYASSLFLLGVLFGYFLLTPFSINFFVTYEVSEQVQNIISLESYISLLSTLVLTSGILFELPMVVYLLSRLGIVTPQMMRNYRKHSFVFILIIAAVITPADPWTQILVSLPVYFLYEMSIFISGRVQPKPFVSEEKLPVG